MNKQLSDEQIDKLMNSLINSSAINDSEIDEIASSRTLWWTVQREIANQRAAVASPWPPSFNWLRVIGFAIPLILLAIVAIGLMNFRSASEPAETAGLQRNEGSPVSEIITVPASEPAAQSQIDNPEISSRPKIKVVNVARTEVKAKRSQNANAVVKVPVPEKNEEVRSDFIALSYAQNPSSGQIVRVKVPSSMKVTLGIVDRVDKPSELVDAEVLVGDDGMTHSIRFIR